jgi:hypothetical protein
MRDWRITYGIKAHKFHRFQTVVNLNIVFEKKNLLTAKE